jgi:hypothetical protein
MRGAKLKWPGLVVLGPVGMVNGSSGDCRDEGILVSASTEIVMDSSRDCCDEGTKSSSGEGVMEGVVEGVVEERVAEESVSFSPNVTRGSCCDEGAS